MAMFFSKNPKMSDNDALQEQAGMELPRKKEIPEGLWEKCKNCEETIFTKQKEDDWNICPHIAVLNY